tara:strand:- start:661 stop:1533 length:873 start_codon:yes stop_codon:yes gene_type:complete
MSEYLPPKLIAEIGCNHKGNFDIAKDLIKIASDCNVDVVKFQKRNSKELLSQEQYNAPHPNPIHSYGQTYGEHREFLEFNLQQHKELKDYSESLALIYSTSVWDVTSAKEIISLKPVLIKVPSACNNNYEMLKILRDSYKGEVHISFGMTTHREEEDIVTFFEEKNQSNRLVLYACTSGYPVPFEDVCMLEIIRIMKKFEKKVKAIGFSGHHLGIAIDIAAFTLGASWIERHFTLDRTWKGTDHAASLEPTGLRKLTRDLKATYKSLSFKENEILHIEKIQREKLKYKNK